MVALYSLRFIASVGIFLHHLNYPLGIGPMCVTFFFVLSGFTTSYSMQQKEFLINGKNLKEYYIGKVKKLYPLYLLTFFISIPVMNYMGINFNFAHIVRNLLMIQVFYPNSNEVFFFNGLGWFLVDIMFFYLITPFIFTLIKKISKNIKMLLILAIAMCCLGFFIAYQFKWKMDPYSFSWWFIYISPYFRFFDYLIGFIFGFVFLVIKNNIRPSTINTIIYSILEIFSVVAFYLIFKSNVLQIDSLRYGIFYVPTSILIIFIFAIGKGMVSKILFFRPLVYLGNLSFIIYMIHQLVINYVTIILGSPMYNHEKTLINNYKSAIFLLIIIICMSDAIKRYVLIPIDILLKKQKTLQN